MKENLTGVTRKNTDLLETLVDLTESLHNLDDSLNASQSSVVSVIILIIIKLKVVL